MSINEEATNDGVVEGEGGGIISEALGDAIEREDAQQNVAPDPNAEAPVEENTEAEVPEGEVPTEVPEGEEETEGEETPEGDEETEGEELSEVDQVKQQYETQIEEMTKKHADDVKRKVDHFKQHNATAAEKINRFTGYIAHFYNQGLEDEKFAEQQLAHLKQVEAQSNASTKPLIGDDRVQLDNDIKHWEKEVDRLKYQNDVLQKEGNLYSEFTMADDAHVEDILNVCQQWPEFNKLASREGKAAAIKNIKDIYAEYGVTNDELKWDLKTTNPNKMRMILEAFDALNHVRGNTTGEETPAAAPKKQLPPKPTKGNGASQPGISKSHKNAVLTDIPDPRVRKQVEIQRINEADKLYPDDPQKWNEHVRGTKPKGVK